MIYAVLPLVGAGIFGALIGSFLNVVIFRVPAGRSIIAPPSACGSCGAGIRPWDNVPVLSWVLLRGRCRDCAASISARYPLVELGTALFFVVVAIHFLSAPSDVPGAGAAVFTVLAYLYLAAVSVTLALIDFDTHTLPNRIVLPTYLVGFALLGGAAVAGGDPSALIRGILGLAILWAIYLGLALIYPGGMGFGDVKLAGVLGLFLGCLGWGELIVGGFAAFLLGGIFGLGLLLTKRASRKSGIPFGPWMLGGAWVGIFFGDQLWQGYLSLLGVA
ncbi:prepilin peptidase [Cryobacterium sinapicolor]|uniref:Prepilin leader peptidase/N-methyltransferase n=1 Tax=Cryobacterium sinapicolor TaxID=1259236 RepID=A0ABY2JG33_9MICO|nr:MULTISPECIES: A24 family peptidase [Cryobacterium]TFC87997.1 prepilin peptidase [Cryobacterium sp. TMT3-29-2]TFD04744.1 prepilin peptidase [Cryobacterium sinapicolor]